MMLAFWGLWRLQVITGTPRLAVGVYLVLAGGGAVSGGVREGEGTTGCWGRFTLAQLTSVLVMPAVCG